MGGRGWLWFLGAKVDVHFVIGYVLFIYQVNLCPFQKEKPKKWDNLTLIFQVNILKYYLFIRGPFNHLPCMLSGPHLPIRPSAGTTPQ